MENNPKAQKFTWDFRKELAAELIAAGRETFEAIGEKVGVNRRQLVRWQGFPEFQNRVEEHNQTWREHVRTAGIANRDRRIRTYIEEFDLTERLIAARAKEFADVPGGSTGLLAVDYKGKDATVPVYTFDAALMAQRLNLRKQLAIELGEWSERRELTGKNGGAMKLELAAVDSILEWTSLEELETLRGISERATERKANGILPGRSRTQGRIG